MNKFLAIAVLTLAAGPIVHPPVARAADRVQTVCATERVSDAGYVLVIAKNLRTALLSRETLHGPLKEADMHCRLLPVRHYPDALNNYLLCQDGRGLIARVYSGGIAGVHFASVRTLEKAGREVIEREVMFGHLRCR
jgi:hypothetical protein